MMESLVERVCKSSSSSLSVSFKSNNSGSLGGADVTLVAEGELLVVRMDSRFEKVSVEGEMIK